MSKNFPITHFPIAQQDQVVGGTYHLGAELYHSAAGSVYETTFGSDARPAAIKIRRIETPDSGGLVARWRNATQLSHPNLLRVYAAGSWEMDGVPVAYVVMERADESLAGVLAERTLSGSETREMLAPALAGLKYLHKNGYAHSHLKASNIHAVGDLLKLSSDDATPVSDGGVPAEDLWALGAVILRALTQESPKMGEDSVPQISREVPEPFRSIVQRCLDPDPATRWTAEQVEARLNARPPLMFPTRPQEPEDEDREAEGVEDRPRGTPKWIYAALAAVVLVVILVAILRNGEPDPHAAVPSPASVTSVLPVPPPEVAAAPAAPSPAVRIPPPVAPAPATVPGRRGAGWSVIVAAYRAREAAEHRSGLLLRKWPAFHWSVQQQHADPDYFLVVVGQNLPEEEAEALRKHAVASGLPRDTYIRRLP